MILEELQPEGMSLEYSKGRFFCYKMGKVIPTSLYFCEN